MNNERKKALEKELKDLEKRFDPHYRRVENFTIWDKQRNIEGRIRTIKRLLNDDSHHNSN